MSEDPTHIPVFVLTGFLGSGKTTLLARLLDDPSLSDTAVLINEFGEVALDHQILERVDDSTVVLKSGCLCCTIKGELADAVSDLYSRREQGLVPRFRRLVIETTGLADPAPIISTFSADRVLRHHFRVAATIATIDAVNGSETLDTQPESIKQIAVADWLAVTKSDICDADRFEQTKAAARSINPDAPLVETAVGDFAIGQLLTERPAVTVSAFYCEPVSVLSAGTHLREVGSCSIQINGDVDWSLFGFWLTMLLHRHGENILRVKGVVYLEGVEHPVALHGVQSLVHPPTHLTQAGDSDRISRLVFIYRGDYAGSILRSLNAFGIPSSLA